MTHCLGESLEAFMQRVIRCVKIRVFLRLILVSYIIVWAWRPLTLGCSWPRWFSLSWNKNIIIQTRLHSETLFWVILEKTTSIQTSAHVASLPIDWHPLILQAIWLNEFALLVNLTQFLCVVKIFLYILLLWFFLRAFVKEMVLRRTVIVLTSTTKLLLWIMLFLLSREFKQGT